MNGDGQHSRVVEEHGLHPVAVVHVDIDVGDPLCAVPEQPGDDDGRVVVDAEAAGLLRHGVVQTSGRVEGVLRPPRPHGLGRRQRGSHHPHGGLVHLGKDRVVARPEPERAPRPVLTVTRPPHDVDVPLGMHEEQLTLERIPCDTLGHALPVDDPVRVDEAAGQGDPSRPQGVL
jgi:hypothetical protein